jgi:1-deoxy-D-xylulose-5-phosphate synthase
MRFVKPLDEQLLHEIFKKFGKIITVEDGTILGGFGSAVLEFMAANQYTALVQIMGIPDQVIEQGSPRELQAECGFDAAAIAVAARKMLKDKIRLITA